MITTEVETSVEQSGVVARQQTHIAFTDNSLALWLLDVDDQNQKRSSTEWNTMAVFEYDFAPDGKWLAFSRQENLKVDSLYLYNYRAKASLTPDSAAHPRP